MAGNESKLGGDAAPGALATLAHALVGVPAAMVDNMAKVVTELVGAGAAVPIKWLQRPVRRMDDEMKARSRAMEALTEAAIARAKEDPEVVGRLAARLVDDLLGKQVNREAVASEAVEEAVRLGPDAAVAAGAQPIDREWLEMFARYAERASTRRMRLLWARVAVREARSPGTFSPVALRLVSELDRTTAAQIGEALSYATGAVVPTDEAWESGRLLRLSLRMQACGLFLNAPGMANVTLVLRGGSAVFAGGAADLLVEGEKDIAKRVPVILLSPIALEVATLLQPTDPRVRLREVALRLDKQSLTRISVVSRGAKNAPELLWSDQSALPSDR